MIEFPCLCGEKFKLTDEMAGEMFQCPKCSRLVAVPTLDDLQHLGTDGTYDIEEAFVPPKRAESPPAVPAGEQQNAVARTEDPGAYDLDVPVKHAPRYDPFTGELVREHEVIVTEDSEAAKTPPKPQPITKMKDRGGVTAPPAGVCFKLFGGMFQTHNLTVLMLMLAAHVFMAAMLAFTIGIGFFFAYVVPAVVLLLSIGYYPIIVQETGPGDHDELPTPLRNFDFGSDVWEPVVYFTLSAGCCLGPGLIVMRRWGDLPGVMLLSYVMLAAGAFIMPAFLLTASVGGIVVNFRPDRMLRVIAIAGFDYLMVVIGWVAGIILIIDGVLGFYAAFLNFFAWKNQQIIPRWFEFGAGLSCVIMFAGQYLSYYSCWLLGLIWRKHYLTFPWVGQHHEPKPVALPPPRAPKPAKTPPTQQGPTIV